MDHHDLMPGYIHDTEAVHDGQVRIYQRDGSSRTERQQVRPENAGPSRPWRNVKGNGPGLDGASIDSGNEAVHDWLGAVYIVPLQRSQRP